MRRKPQPEGRAARGKVRRGYGAAVRLHDGLDDRETYPGAAPRGSTAEALEDIGQFLVRDASPVVTYLDDDALPVWVRCKLDPSAFFGVANGVLDQAVERRLETLTIGHYGRRGRAQPPVAVRGGPPACHGPLKLRIERHDRGFHGPMFVHPGKGQQAGRDPLQVVELLEHHDRVLGGL